jgi:beta-xylosidase
MKLIAAILLVIPFISTAQTDLSKVWVADNGNGTYKNPVINADYSDPDAIRVGDDYYMISSSFTQIPGLPILHSKDLVNWKLIGHALHRQPPYDVYDKVQHGAGVWAPSIRFHNNEFYIYYPDPDFGIYLIKSKQITGPWSEPVLVEAGKGLIDPCPLWDDNGKAYLAHAYAGSRAGFKSILVIKEMNAAGNRVIGHPVMVFDGHDADPTVEGPKLYKRNGYYYIFAPAGGVSTGWQLVLRSKQIYGPYEKKLVMDQGTSSVNGPHQGAWVNTTSGEDWFLHFQDKEAYGRVVHLQPMKWVNNWPLIGADKDNDGKGEPVMTYKKPNPGRKYPVTTVQDSDEFNAPTFGLQWQWQANPKEGWAFPTADGSLRMFSVWQTDSLQGLWMQPAILGQKIPADEFKLKVKVSFHPKFRNEKFGLLLLGADYAYIAVEKREEGLFLVCRENTGADKKGTEKERAVFPVKGNSFVLELTMTEGGNYHFGFIDKEGISTSVVREFKAKPGRWVGARIGLFCLRNNNTNDAGYADVDWVRFEKMD